ncbi:hypothetical protein I553_4627 [Mycobacterium xenopi 4042]|uniref:NAD binding domain of 6-phosphogluconate dehydrogenase family protein n=1 Tax=Mycobacterium xenopi 4042 TaxID=1299334 RepID=X8AHP0_MYCXE|nr:hypothetical protein I553_4627 [Mycobacterium xenopi 4042]EUA51077.1 hypothetical protein I552_2018 [Mycobacterium xenopi 3993]
MRALGRSAEKRAGVAELGAAAVADVCAAAAAADVVVVCVFSDEQVRHVCLDSDLLVTMAPVRRWSCTPPQVLPPSRRSPPTPQPMAWPSPMRR